MIAYGKGGALETVVDGKTGTFFFEQTPESLIEAIKSFEEMRIKPEDCRDRAKEFDNSVFKQQMRAVIEKYFKEGALYIISGVDFRDVITGQISGV